MNSQNSVCMVENPEIAKTRPPLMWNKVRYENVICVGPGVYYDAVVEPIADEDKLHPSFEKRLDEAKKKYADGRFCAAWIAGDITLTNRPVGRYREYLRS